MRPVAAPQNRRQADLLLANGSGSCYNTACDRGAPDKKPPARRMGAIMAIRIILLDIDGTLATSQKQISPNTKAALLRAQESGIKLALCSGRPDRGLYPWAEELHMTEHGGFFVCYNGGKVLNCQTGEVLFNQPLPIEEAKAVLEHMKRFQIMPMISCGEYMYVTDVFRHDIRPGMPEFPEIFNVMRYEARGNGYLLCEKRDLAVSLDHPLNKILTYGDPSYLKEHWREMAAPFAGRLTCMFTAPFYFEFTAKGVDKAKAIDSALLPLGYRPSEMMAFGDAQNDVSMLRYAGLGIAMGNASDEVKQLAAEVTAGNDEDGIALSLHKHLPELF